DTQPGRVEPLVVSEHARSAIVLRDDEVEVAVTVEVTDRHSTRRQRKRPCVVRRRGRDGEPSALAPGPNGERRRELASQVESIWLRLQTTPAEDGLRASIEFVVDQGEREFCIDADAAARCGRG